jgi:CHAT domain-containing protein
MEEELAVAGTTARPDSGTLVRVATIESAIGNTAAAEHAIDASRSAAAQIKQPRVRAKLFADIDSAAGAIVRKHHPQRSVELLSRAIAYERQSRRQLVLPELHLELARAHIALRAWAEAERDLDEGMRQLEQQRDHVDEAELRPGLFDSSAALFHESVSLQLRLGGDPARVLAYIERGRARAMLEQLGESRNPPTLAEVQRNLGEGMALVEYMSLPERLVIVAVTRDRALVQTVPVPRALPTDYAALYDLLIRPIADVTRDARAITFVSDDTLQRVPFAALLDRDTRSFLVEHHTLATAPSAGIAILTMQREQHGRPASALVFANPTIPRDTFPDLESLAASEYEAKAVAKRYPRAEILKRDDATAECFLALAPFFDVVHFAGHAVVRNEEPGASALVCASSPKVHGALTLRQIAAMRFTKTRVMVLAACSTMSGRNAAIEGVPSLARAFVVAGVPAVVGTLWDIDDVKAAPLMRVLHEELAKGVAPADALRAAQLAAIRDKKPVEQWAAFAVTGMAH